MSIGAIRENDIRKAVDMAREEIYVAIIGRTYKYESVNEIVAEILKEKQILERVKAEKQIKQLC